MREFFSVSRLLGLAAGLALGAITGSPLAGLLAVLGLAAVGMWSRRPAWTRLASTEAMVGVIDERIDMADVGERDRFVHRTVLEADRASSTDPAQRFRLRMAAAWAAVRVKGPRDAQRHADPMMSSLHEAPADSIRYTVGVLLQLDTASQPQPWAAAPRGYRTALKAWEARPAAYSTLARGYARELSDRGELELAATLLRNALAHSERKGSNLVYRGRPDGHDEHAWALRLELAQLLSREGHLGEAWLLVEQHIRGDAVREIQAATFQFNAGYVLDACLTLHDASSRVGPTTRMAALRQLIGLLEDVEAREAAASFRRALGEHAPAPFSIRSESEARAQVTATLAEYGGDHPFVSDALLNLAHAQLRCGHAASALSSVLQARAIAEAHCGPDDPQLIKLLELESLVETPERARGALARIERLRELHRFDQIEALRP